MDGALGRKMTTRTVVVFATLTHAAQVSGPSVRPGNGHSRGQWTFPIQFMDTVDNSPDR